ncbi:hypothetical protein [Kaarinaea lacus]
MYILNTKQQGVTDLFFEIGRGNVYGASVVHKFGRVTGVGTSATNDIWDVGGTYQFPTTACAVNIQSSGSSDASANEGAKTVQIYGLDGNYNELSETVALNGTDVVQSSGSYLRLYRMKVLTAGSIGEAQGNISASHIVTGVISQINQGFNQTLMAIYTVPASKTGLLYTWTAAVDRDGSTVAKGGDIKLQFREFGSVFQTKDILGLVNDNRQRDYLVPQKIPQKTDIKTQASAAGNDTAFSCTFDIVLLDNHI